MVQAIELYLDQIDYRVGDTAIHYESRDTASPTRRRSMTPAA